MMVCRREERRAVDSKKDWTTLIVRYPPQTEKMLQVIIQYYLEVDGMKVSRNEAFRRAVLILANEITKRKDLQR